MAAQFSQVQFSVTQAVQEWGAIDGGSLDPQSFDGAAGQD
jgi:hypothetical protein